MRNETSRPSQPSINLHLLPSWLHDRHERLLHRQNSVRTQNEVKERGNSQQTVFPLLSLSAGGNRHATLFSNRLHPLSLLFFSCTKGFFSSNMSAPWTQPDNLALGTGLGMTTSQSTVQPLRVRRRSSGRLLATSVSGS